MKWDIDKISFIDPSWEKLKIEIKDTLKDKHRYWNLIQGRDNYLNVDFH